MAQHKDKKRADISTTATRILSRREREFPVSAAKKLLFSRRGTVRGRIAAGRALLGARKLKRKKK